MEKGSITKKKHVFYGVQTPLLKQQTSWGGGGGGGGQTKPCVFEH